MVTAIANVSAAWFLGIAALSCGPTSMGSSDDGWINIAYPRPFRVTYDNAQGAVTEPRSGRRFSVSVRVEAERAGQRVTRFMVYAPDDGMRPLAVRVARFLGLLWAYADSRFPVLNSRLRTGQASVWLCRDGEGGAEQSRDSIYLYDAMAERSDLEWARTLAHEYGHYLLPGPTGYLQPEPWANGLLGERLFLGWLYEDIRANKLSPRDAAFLSMDSVSEYYAKQVAPLVERIKQNGVDRKRMVDRGREGMDEAIALLLYATRLHGDSALADMLEWLPTRTGRHADGADYLQGYEGWLRGSDLIRHRPGALMSHGTTQQGKEHSAEYQAYIPAGRWRVMSGAEAIRAGSTRAVRSADGHVVQVTAAGWQTVRVDFSGSDAGLELRWVRERP